MDKVERVAMTSFPDVLYEEAIEGISRFSVGISGIDVDGHREVSRQSGSGTLVDLDGTLCIVTADHVIDHVRHRDRVGLLTDWRGESRRCVFDKIHLHYVRLPRGASEDLGPDLGAMLLPSTGEGLATLQSQKVFYNLGKRIERFASSYPALSAGVWFPCGVLGEDSRRLPPERGFSNVTGHWGMIGLAPAPVESRRDGFDYLDLRGHLGVDLDMPDSFGGASGGGLWQGLIEKRVDGRLNLRELIFSGVIFYQSDVLDGARTLRSHGRASRCRRRMREASQAFPHPRCARPLPQAGEAKICA